MFFTKLTDRIHGLVCHCIKLTCEEVRSDAKPATVAAVRLYDVLTDEVKWYECNDPVLLREMPSEDLSPKAERLVNEHLEHLFKIGWGE